MNTYANTLWLAAPPDGDEEAVQSLLIHARRQVPSRRPISIDYPAHEFSQAFQAAGFTDHQTLIWMSISFNQN